MLSAIIVAGGSSRRMGSDKAFAVIAGKPVIAHSIAAFQATSSVSDIILVGRDGKLAALRAIVSSEGFGKVGEIVGGGLHRQDSVTNALKYVSSGADFIAVHDAARPLVRPEQIEQVLAAARQHGAAALASPMRDTLKRADAAHFVTGSIARENVFAMETPQIFARELLLRAYAAVARDQLAITDEVSAIEHVKGKVVLVRHGEANFKITYPADLLLADFVLRNRER
ncbi:MAG: 2-C-methyl-D-erythritol 4-phosphate cytidylyltransferase [Verrucomicrobiota bacterium]|nr:2-C-methyl-D-erythritol 4-phosphate cytidylyltransferase [Chthoniobacterales bacterium]MDQ3313409.1 2-C-methyl-D-erythritol 4-phosphate cytidylyltransferase [Verrucomicrobiota bacterium]